MRRSRDWSLRGARTLGAAVASLTLLAAASAQETEPPAFGGSIEVTLILTEVRVVDDFGNPVEGLGPSDFAVSLNGEPAEVEAAEWIPAPGGDAEPEAPAWSRLDPAVSMATAPVRLPGRLVVILFQTDFHGSRLAGLFRMSDHAAELVRGLTPVDRAALAVFGAHLELHADFTDDHDRLASLLTVPSLVSSIEVEHPGPFPSLAAHLDLAAARRAASLSQALTVLGDALSELPGPKSVVLFGWGLGRYTSSHTVWLGRDYADARFALARARASVFSLDVTDADAHTLEVGLESVSRDTGGFYVKTHLFPEQAMARLAGALAGHYELAIRKPVAAGDTYAIDVRVDRPDTTVLARPLAVDLAGDAG